MLKIKMIMTSTTANLEDPPVAVLQTSNLGRHHQHHCCRRRPSHAPALLTPRRSPPRPAPNMMTRSQGWHLCSRESLTAHQSPLQGCPRLPFHQCFWWAANPRELHIGHGGRNAFSFSKIMQSLTPWHCTCWHRINHFRRNGQVQSITAPQLSKFSKPWTVKHQVNSQYCPIW